MTSPYEERTAAPHAASHGRLPQQHSVRSQLGYAVEAIAYSRSSTVCLRIAIAIWLLYEIFVPTSHVGKYITAFPLNVAAAVDITVYFAVVFGELCRIYRGDYRREDAFAIAVFIVMSAGLFHLGLTMYANDAALVFAARHEEFRKLLKFCIAVIALGVIVVFALCIMGAVEDTIWVRGDGHKRHGLGFYYCLSPSLYLFSITCALCWLRDRRMRWFELLLLTAANCTLFLLTDSRLSFVLSLAALLIVIGRKACKSDSLWSGISRVSAWSFVATSIASVIALAAYSIAMSGEGKTIALSINALLGTRLQLALDGMANLGWKIFGQNVIWYGAGTGALYNYVDNLYFHSLIEAGAVYTVGIIALYTAVSRRAAIRGDYMLTLMLALFAAHFLIDDLALFSMFNPMLFACGSYLMGSASPKDEEQRGKHSKRP